MLHMVVTFKAGLLSIRNKVCKSLKVGHNRDTMSSKLDHEKLTYINIRSVLQS